MHKTCLEVAVKLQEIEVEEREDIDVMITIDPNVDILRFKVSVDVSRTIQEETDMGFSGKHLLIHK